MHKLCRIFLKLLLLVALIPLSLYCVVVVAIAGVLRPFAPTLSRKIARTLPLALWTVCHGFFRLSIDLSLPKAPEGSALVIANHIGATDFMLVNALNTFNFTEAKYAIKHSLIFFPVFYQGCLLVDFLVIRRNFELDRPSIKHYFAELIKRKAPLWFVFYPEGHRITEARRAESQAFCSKREIEPFENVLCPRYKGFELVAQCLQDSHVENVLDLTFYCTQGAAPSLTEIFLSWKVFKYRCDMRVVPIREVTAPKEFLEAAFRRKDALIEKWKHEGCSKH
ncbi:lysocardiolipin and lysophospholipid acyltransferase [Pancytospora philotis]|nr:lysocardiolipin and lysophospholipid acyltransferase [Pancytospora philotis]